MLGGGGAVSSRALGYSTPLGPLLERYNSLPFSCRYTYSVYTTHYPSPAHAAVSLEEIVQLLRSKETMGKAIEMNAIKE